MKRRIISISFILSILALSFISCDKEPVDDNDPDYFLTFEDVVSFDYDYLKRNETKKLHFYEVECTLNGLVSVNDPENIYIVESTTIAVDDNTVYEITTDYKTADWTKITIPGHWAGCFTIPDPTAMNITFDEAVEILKSQTDFSVPASDKCTFRHPLGANTTTMYIFGSNNDFVGIDAMTGEVRKVSSSSFFSEEEEETEE